MSSINVAVHGALGRMGQEVLRAVSAAADMRPVGGADAKATADSMPLPDGSGEIPASRNLADLLEGADAVVDFSVADAAMPALRTAAARGVNVVVGTTGLSESDYAEAGDLADEHGVGVIIAPNFAMGAVLMIHLAKVAAPFFDYADLTEMHHEAKIDAPLRHRPGDSARGGGRQSGRRRVRQRPRRKAANPQHPRRRLRRRKRPQRTDARTHGAPRTDARRAGADADNTPRLHQPRELHARRDNGDPRSGEAQRADSGAGEDNGAGVRGIIRAD